MADTRGPLEIDCGQRISEYSRSGARDRNNMYYTFRTGQNDTLENSRNGDVRHRVKRSQANVSLWKVLFIRIKFVYISVYISIAIEYSVLILVSLFTAAISLRYNLGSRSVHNKAIVFLENQQQL